MVVVGDVEVGGEALLVAGAGEEAVEHPATSATATAPPPTRAVRRLRRWARGVGENDTMIDPNPRSRPVAMPRARWR